MTHRITITLDENFIGTRLDKALSEALPDVSRERVKALLHDGHVTDVSGHSVRDGKSKLVCPVILCVQIPAATAASAQAQDIQLNIAYEDDDVIVVDKPAGLVVHPAAGNLDGTLVNALLHHCSGQLSGIGGVARPGIVHRIDKDTSGLIISAKHDRAHDGLARQFADHSIHRRYIAVVHGHPAPRAGTINAAIGRSSTHRTKMAVVDAGRGKHAITHYTTQTVLRESSLIECALETGRTHQIRVHMAHIGHALLGDPVYSRARKGISMILKAENFQRQALHAAELGFIHPVTGAEIRLKSALPDDFTRLVSALQI